MWRNRPLHQGLSQPSQEFFKLQERGEEVQGPPATAKETETSSQAEDTSPEEEQTPEDGPEQA